MNMDSFSLISDFDGAHIAMTEISADEPRFLFQITHGMAEHRARYYPFMEYIASLGGACIAGDMRGHGETAGEANYGYFGDDAVDAVLSDVAQTGDVLRRKYGELPFVLLGHSMGSLVARSYAALHDEQLSALILTGEASYNPGVGAGLAVARLISCLRGGRHHSRLVDHLATGVFNRGFEADEGSDGKFLWLSADLQNRQAFEADPACGFPFTVNGYIALFSFMKHAYSPKNWNVRNPDMPVLFLSGEDDPVMVSKKRFDDAVSFVRDMGYRNVSSRLYPGMRHEILNETDRQLVYEDIRVFLSGIFPGENA
ncbi:MAG: alpha/beta fold hydrolase [Eubacteriales bacterium]